MPKRLLLVASTTGYQTRVFAEGAVRLGYELALATDRCHVLEDPWGDHAIPLRFDEPDSAAEAVAQSGFVPEGIVAVGDRPAYLASLIAARFGLPFHSPDAVAVSRNKFLARERWRAAGLLVPAYERVPLDSTHADLPFPCVLKPLGLSASRGVIRVNSPAEFAVAAARIAAMLRTPDILRMHEDQDRFLQVESFIEGHEFALEGILTGGQLQVLAIFDKPDPLDGPFFEETIYVTPSRAERSIQNAIVETTGLAARAAGLSHGPIHAEMRVNARGVWMLEVAARPIGGLCAKALRFDGGGLEELILRHAAGADVSGARPASGASGVMMIPIPRGGIYQGVRGDDEARAVPAIEEIVITALPGQQLVPLPEGATYLGFIFARASEPAEAERALRAAHELLEFEIATSLPVLRY